MVQVQKPQIREALLEAAKHEFLERGFQQASTRRIAASAGTTIGNMYKYFQSKDELFEQLVSGAKEQLYFFIKEHETESGEIPQAAHKQLQWFVDLMSEYRDEMLLLVDASDGTKYQNTYEELIAMISLNLKEHLPDFNISAVPDAGILVRTIAVGLLSGCIDVLRHHSDKTEIKSGLTQYFLFVFKSFL